MSGRRALLVITISLVALASGGCRALQGAQHEAVTALPAPTTVPLPSATLTRDVVPSMTPTREALQGVTLSPTVPSVTPFPEPTATAIPTSVPTRVVPPAEPVDLVDGFGISVFAQGLSGPRMMALAPDDRLCVAERGAGRIVCLPDRDGDGVADEVQVVASGLRAPSSIAFYSDGSLYIGETQQILRLSQPDETGFFQAREVIVDGLPSGGHNTRTVLFSPDGSTLFVSVGSSCNVCVEEDERRATVMRYTSDGRDGQVFAQGLRNAVGITFRPGTDELWATNNGRDWLGDDAPPETIHLVRQGDDAGWPRCHAGRIVDPEFGGPDACQGVAPPVVEMQAHSAPLGLTFYTGRQFPERYQGGLFVAFHGSWNRTVPTGYKVVWMPVSEGTPGPVYDFAAGWLRADGSYWGRPVDVLTGPDGSLFVSDDDRGNIYRIFYGGE